MHILSKAFDKRINCWNFYLECTIEEYLSFAEDILRNNDFQRQRVRTSRTVYSLLKEDLKQGCVIPPLVLAASRTTDLSPDSVSGEELSLFFHDNKNLVLILDGLQRTYTLIDARNDLSQNESMLNEYYKNHLRLEFYMDINRFGVLYRMLTLNTGQTPMTSRHQIEILYSDLLGCKIEGIELISDNDGMADPSDNQFVFKNVIDGFNSYLNRSELPIDRQGILDNIAMLENMSNEDLRRDVFSDFIKCYSNIFSSLRRISNDYVFSDDDLAAFSVTSSPFGLSVSKVFSSSQALTGFGAALGKLKDNGIISDEASIINLLPELEDKNGNDYEWFGEMLNRFDTIKQTSKKIGNAQRMFFLYFFRELFNENTESFLILKKAVQNGYQKYYSQVN